MRQIQQKVDGAGKPIRYIIDTTLDPDHTGGNATIASKGLTVMQAPGGVIPIRGGGLTATVFSHENSLARMAQAKPARKFHGQFTNRYVLYPRR